MTEQLARIRATNAYKVGVAEATINSLLARRDLSPGARETVEVAASLLGMDDPTEDGAR